MKWAILCLGIEIGLLRRVLSIIDVVNLFELYVNLVYHVNYFLKALPN